MHSGSMRLVVIHMMLAIILVYMLCLLHMKLKKLFLCFALIVSTCWPFFMLIISHFKKSVECNKKAIVAVGQAKFLIFTFYNRSIIQPF